MCAIFRGGNKDRDIVAMDVEFIGYNVTNTAGFKDVTRPLTPVPSLAQASEGSNKIKDYSPRPLGRERVARGGGTGEGVFDKLNVT